MKRLGPLEKRLFIWCVTVGMTLTLVTLLLDAAGFLTPLERWIYDHRARWCQAFSKPPTNQIVHLDIDDKALDAVGRWPWPRSQFARMLDELALAKPKVVGIDIAFSDPTPPIPLEDGTLVYPKDDDKLAASIKRMGNVVSAISLQLRPAKKATSNESAALTELTENLELTSVELGERLAKRGLGADQISEITKDNLYLLTRRQAAFIRVQHELKQAPLALEQLTKRVLPKSDPNLKSPLQRLVQDQYIRAAALQAAMRFTAALPASIVSPRETEPNLIPLVAISNASQSLGFVDADITDSVQRYVPLFVECEGRVFAQFGFAFGARIVGADPSAVQFSDNSVKLFAGNQTIEVPVRMQTSTSFQRRLGQFADIPWFGGPQWESMYDWPAHRDATQHFSMGFVWDVVQLSERLRRNNDTADAAMQDILDEGKVDQTTQQVGLDRAKFRKFLSKPLKAEDATGRVARIKETLEILYDWLGSQSTTSLTPKKADHAEQARQELMIRAERNLKLALQQNTLLEAQLKTQRERLAKEFHDKGVMIGWTATGAADSVTTSLHTRCPGVVVHGAIANAVITGEWWRTSPAWISVVVTLLVGFGGSVITGLYRPIVATIGALLIIVIFAIINGYLVFDYGNYLMNAAAPLTAIGLVWAGATATRAIIEGVERVRAEFAKVNLEKEKLRLENEKMIAEKDLQTFRHEMELAKTVQVALIPKESPTMDGIENHGWNKPADMTGGDCFDLWKLPDGRLGILLADASGHGLAPAMIVSQVRTLVRALAETETHPDTILNRVNARLAADLEASRFVTCFLGFIDGMGECHWASAGHGPMLWNERLGEPMKELDSTALPLGIDGDWMGDLVPPLQLEESGMLLVMSDGIFEAPDPQREQFGVERVLEIVKARPEASAVEITAAIRDAVTAWQQKDSPADDQTTIIIRRVASGVSVTVVEDKSASQPVETPGPSSDAE